MRSIDLNWISEGQKSGNTSFSRVLKPEESPTIVETYKEMEKLMETGKLPCCYFSWINKYKTSCDTHRESKDTGRVQLFYQDPLANSPALQDRPCSKPGRGAPMLASRGAQSFLQREGYIAYCILSSWYVILLTWRIVPSAQLQRTRSLCNFL